MRSTGSDGVRPPDPRDRELWRRSQTATTQPDEAERFLDLAAFADGRLDEDDDARVAALLARDPAAAADVAAARALATTAMPADEQLVARAAALADDFDSRRADAGGEVIAFPVRAHTVGRSWSSVANWGGLAAALVLASWLGFDLGRGFYDFGMGRPTDDISLNSLIDPAGSALRDFTENSQI